MKSISILKIEATKHVLPKPLSRAIPDTVLLVFSSRRLTSNLESALHLVVSHWLPFCIALKELGRLRKQCEVNSVHSL